MDDLLARNNLAPVDEEMKLSKNRTACGTCDENGRKYYIVYQGPGAQVNTKEQAKALLEQELNKRFK